MHSTSKYRGVEFLDARVFWALYVTGEKGYMWVSKKRRIWLTLDTIVREELAIKKEKNDHERNNKSYEPSKEAS